MRTQLFYALIIVFTISSCGPSQEEIQSTVQAVTTQTEMVLVPEGEFMMGSNEAESAEQPVHHVYLDAYYIDKYEVTNALYKLCVNAGTCRKPYSSKKYNDPEYAQHPVVYVNWSMAKTFCEWRGARLPTEAEWEKAARGTDGRTYPWGNEFNGSLVNFCDKNCSENHADKNSDDGYAETSPVGNYPKGVSPYGAYDMAGNVWEWVADGYLYNYYTTYPVDQWPSNPTGPGDLEGKVLRGGAWNNTNHRVRIAFRMRLDKDRPSEASGFRCATNFLP